MSSGILQGLRDALRVAKISSQIIEVRSPKRFRDSWNALSLIVQVRDHTMVDVPRLKLLYDLTKELDSQGIPGDLVTCGVYRGGSSAVLAGANRKSDVQRNSWLFDSFEGLPEPTQRNGFEAQETYHKGWCTASEDEVRQLFACLGFMNSNVHIVKGWFQDTLPFAPIRQIALLHIDADWYNSVSICLTTLFDRVRPNGVIVLDDYGTWEGCRNATNDFFSARNLDLALLRYRGPAAYFRKPASL